MFLILALPVISALASSPVRMDNCDDIGRSRRTGTSIQSHSDRDDQSSLIRFTRSSDGHCETATIVGVLVFTPEEDDVVSIPFGASAFFRELTGSSDRALSLSRGPDGQIMRSYQINGRSATYDADAQRWLAGFLPRIVAASGINVKPRVARWRSMGGVDNVLSHIEALGSSGSMTAHYEALLEGAQLSDSELDRTLRSVGDHMTESSGDLSRVLIRLAPAAGRRGYNTRALEAAFSHIPSSGDKTNVLRVYGQTNDREMLAAVMRAASTIPSSGDKLSLLRTLAPRYLAEQNASLTDEYFRVASSIPSSGDMRSVLNAAIPYASSNGEIARHIIAVARQVPSSGDRTDVLLHLVSSGALKTRELREDFLRAAASIPSEGDRSRVLEAAARY